MRSLPVLISHSRTVRSWLPLRSVRPSGVKASETTMSVWPLKRAGSGVVEPDLPVVAPGGQRLAVGAVGDVHHPVDVRQRAQHLAAGDFPDARRRVVTARSELFAVRGEGHGANAVAVAVEGAHV